MPTRKPTAPTAPPSHSIVISRRPRSEVPRAPQPLPPKSRRRYKRASGPRFGNIGRFQRPMRWSVMGKLIIPDFRPCWRCTLGADACATCTNARRATAEVAAPECSP